MTMQEAIGFTCLEVIVEFWKNSGIHYSLDPLDWFEKWVGGGEKMKLASMNHSLKCS